MYLIHPSQVAYDYTRSLADRDPDFRKFGRQSFRNACYGVIQIYEQNKQIHYGGGGVGAAPKSQQNEQQHLMEAKKVCQQAYALGRLQAVVGTRNGKFDCWLLLTLSINSSLTPAMMTKTLLQR